MDIKKIHSENQKTLKKSPDFFK